MPALRLVLRRMRFVRAVEHTTCVTDRVVLDTNVLVANFRSGNDFRLLLEGARTAQIVLVVPELVIREAANKHREEAIAKWRDLEKAASGLDRLGVKVAPLEDMTPAAASIRYEHLLRRRLAEVDALVPSLPAVSHDKLLTKALDRRKPFAGSDAGYRDALLWETILEQAAIGATVFCTMNTKHFADAADRHVLAADLVTELASAGLTDAVTLSIDLHTLVRDLVDVDVVATNEVERMLPELERVLEDDIGARLFDHDFRSDALRKIKISPERLTASDLDVEGVEVLDAQIVHVSNLSHLDVVEVIANSDDELLLSLYAEIDAELDLDLEVHVYDDDGSRYLSRADATSKTLGVSVETTYSRRDDTIGDVSISDVQIL